MDKYIGHDFQELYSYALIFVLYFSEMDKTTTTIKVEDKEDSVIWQLTCDAILIQYQIIFSNFYIVFEFNYRKEEASWNPKMIVSSSSFKVQNWQRQWHLFKIQDRWGMRKMQTLNFKQERKLQTLVFLDKTVTRVELSTLKYFSKTKIFRKLWTPDSQESRF